MAKESMKAREVKRAKLIVLFIHQDPNSGHGLWHYVIGIILTVIGLGHFFKRIKLLVKGLKQIKK